MKTFLISVFALVAAVLVAVTFSTPRFSVAAAPAPGGVCGESIGTLIFSQLTVAQVSRCLPAVGENFVAVTLFDGQGVRAVVSNVLAPAAGTTVAACPVTVAFFNGEGNAVGNPETVNLNPGASATVAAKFAPRVVRASFTLFADPSNPTEPGDPNNICAIRSSQEVFEVFTGRTVSANPSPNCIGHGVSAGFTRPCA
jgi:hypothetical protein